LRKLHVELRMGLYRQRRALGVEQAGMRGEVGREDRQRNVRRFDHLVLMRRVFARAGVTAAFSRFAEHGVRTVVGTDGYNMDLLGELNAASLISKITSARADVANSPQLIEANTAIAADVIKRPDLGRIEPGATADLTIVDLTHPHLQPLFDPRRALIALANRANIDQVMVDGRMLVDGGRYLGADEAAITAAGTAAIGKIWDLPEAQAAFNG
jgi:imidazolonepropionase-like amidohydrolase